MLGPCFRCWCCPAVQHITASAGGGRQEGKSSPSSPGKTKKNALPLGIVQLKQGLKCMRSVRVSSQLLVSELFIGVPTNAENFSFFLHLYI